MLPLKWMDDALCREVGQELFFPEHASEISEPKQTCSLCTVRSECLDYALSLPFVVEGVWGGTTERQRRKLRQRIA